MTVRNGSMASSPVKSAARVLQVFELFAAIRRPAALKEIVDRLDYPQSSATVLLKSLVQLGYLQYDREVRKYFPTPKIAQLGGWLDSRIDDRIIVVMEELGRRIRETILLAARNDQYLQYVKVIDSAHEIRFHIIEGSQIPLTQTSLGWMFLSQMPVNEAEKLCKQINARMTDPSKRIEISSIAERFAEIRRNGYCYLPNVPLKAGGCVAMMLPPTGNGQRLAIGVGGIVARIDEKLNEIVNYMRSSLEQIDAS